MTEEERAEKAEQKAPEGKSDQADGKESNQQDSADESKAHGPKPAIKPVKEKIGEGRDNLQRREGWYQRRTGGKS